MNSLSTKPIHLCDLCDWNLTSLLPSPPLPMLGPPSYIFSLPLLPLGSHGPLNAWCSTSEGTAPAPSYWGEFTTPLLCSPFFSGPTPPHTSPFQFPGQTPIPSEI